MLVWNITIGQFICMCLLEGSILKLVSKAWSTGMGQNDQLKVIMTDGRLKESEQNDHQMWE